MSAVQKFHDFLTDREFQEYVQLIRELTGIQFRKDKKNMIEYRIGKRLFDKGLNPQQYLQLVQTSDEEMKFFINQLTTHKTDWFRENEHFDFLKNRFNKHQGPLYVWSAACSTGEEPYTIMMTLGEAGVSYDQQRILATDISAICVNSARQGMYPLEALESGVSKKLIQKYFVQASGLSKHNSAYAMVNPLWGENAIKFKELNLNAFELPQTMKFDVIFIRNVLIYFEPLESIKIIKNLTQYLRPRAYLILGLTEPLQRPHELNLKRVHKSIYQYE
jgi:chemotaxis protein methyltransferase CheR